MIRWYMSYRMRVWRTRMQDALWLAMARWGFRVEPYLHAIEDEEGRDETL